MAKSMGITTAELAKQMELGNVYSKDVLPNFGRALKDWARNNGALDKSLNNLRVQQARMITQTQLSGNIIFKSGWGEGLSDLYKTITEELTELEPLMKSIGRIGGSVFKGLSRLIKMISVPLQAFGSFLDYITDKTGDWSAALLTVIPLIAMFMRGLVVSKLTAMGGGFAAIASGISKIPAPIAAIGRAMTALVGKILIPLMLMEEFVNFFTGGKSGVWNPTGQSLPDRITSGMMGTTGKKGQEMIEGGDIIQGNVLRAASVGVNLVDKILSNSLPFDTNLSGGLDAYINGLESFNKRSLIATPKPNTGYTPSVGYGASRDANIKVDVNVTGLMTEDAVNKVGNIVESKLQDTFGTAAN